MVRSLEITVKQDCIWPRAILCIIPAQKSEDLAEFEFCDFQTPASIPQPASDSARSYFDVTHTQLRAGSPDMIARQVQKKFGTSARIGISVNAPLSQYAASQSLAGIPYVIAPWKISSELNDKKLENLLFIQKSLLQRLQLHSIEKVNQLRSLDRLEISRRFGLRGLGLLDILNGQDFFTHINADDFVAKCITEYLVLPPNTKGKKLILRYIKQISFRLARKACAQNKHGKNILLTLFYKNYQSTGCIAEIDGSDSGKYIFKKLTEKLPVKCFSEIILALELKLVDAEHISGQEELPLECFG